MFVLVLCLAACSKTNLHSSVEQKKNNSNSADESNSKTQILSEDDLLEMEASPDQIVHEKEEYIWVLHNKNSQNENKKLIVDLEQPLKVLFKNARVHSNFEYSIVLNFNKMSECGSDQVKFYLVDGYDDPKPLTIAWPNLVSFFVYDIEDTKPNKYKVMVETEIAENCDASMYRLEFKLSPPNALSLYDLKHLHEILKINNIKATDQVMKNIYGCNLEALRTTIEFFNDHETSLEYDGQYYRGFLLNPVRPYTLELLSIKQGSTFVKDYGFDRPQNGSRYYNVGFVGLQRDPNSRKWLYLYQSTYASYKYSATNRENPFTCRLELVGGTTDSYPYPKFLGEAFDIEIPEKPLRDPKPCYQQAIKDGRQYAYANHLFFPGTENRDSRRLGISDFPLNSQKFVDATSKGVLWRFKYRMGTQTNDPLTPTIEVYYSDPHQCRGLRVSH